MSYNDELGAILDKLEINELEDFAVNILKLNQFKVLELKEAGRLQKLRRLCSRELRSASGHLVCNLWRGKHDLPYIEIVRDVAGKMKISYGDNYDVLLIERELIEKPVQIAWDKADENQKKEITEEVKQLAISKGKTAIASKITLDSMKKIIAEGITQKTALSILGVSPVASTAGSVLGYNIIQKILLQTLYRYFGLWTAGEAVLGIGAAGAAMNIARFANPILFGASALYTAHQIAGPAYRKTVPAVIFLAHKRLEKFS